MAIRARSIRPAAEVTSMTLKYLTLVIAILWSTTACSVFKVTADVSSSTSWSGSFNGRTVSGTGDMKVDMGIAGSAKCAVVQKETRNGFLTVSISGGESKTTTAEFGVVSVCSN